MSLLRRDDKPPRPPRETLTPTPPPDGESAVYPLDETCELQVTRTCWRCHGQRYIGPPVVTCVVCQARYTADQLHPRQYRYILPCQHALPASQRAYKSLECPTCGGTGELYARITFGDWLDWLLSQIVFEDTEDALDMSQRTTARRRAIG